MINSLNMKKMMEVESLEKKIVHLYFLSLGLQHIYRTTLEYMQKEKNKKIQLCKQSLP